MASRLVNFRLARPASLSLLTKRRGLATTSDLPPKTATNRENVFFAAKRNQLNGMPGAEVTLQRFWKDVAVERRDGQAKVSIMLV